MVSIRNQILKLRGNFMQIQNSIEKKIKAELNPELLQIENESGKHGFGHGQESHFKITVVSNHFVEMKKIIRHRCLYQLLASEIEDGVHALALHLYTPQEWEKVILEFPRRYISQK